MNQWLNIGFENELKFYRKITNFRKNRATFERIGFYDYLFVL